MNRRRLAALAIVPILAMTVFLLWSDLGAPKLSEAESAIAPVESPQDPMISSGESMTEPTGEMTESNSPVPTEPTDIVLSETQFDDAPTEEEAREIVCETTGMMCEEVVSDPNPSPATSTSNPSSEVPEGGSTWENPFLGDYQPLPTNQPIQPTPEKIACPESRDLDPVAYEACRAGYARPSIIWDGYVSCKKGISGFDNTTEIVILTGRIRLVGGNYKDFLWDFYTHDEGDESYQFVSSSWVIGDEPYLIVWERSVEIYSMDANLNGVIDSVHARGNHLIDTSLIDLACLTKSD